MTKTLDIKSLKNEHPTTAVDPGFTRLGIPTPKGRGSNLLFVQFSPSPPLDPPLHSQHKASCFIQVTKCEATQIFNSDTLELVSPCREISFCIRNMMTYFTITIAAPVFVIQHLFDEAQITVDNVGPPIKKEQWQYIHNMGKDIANTLRNVS